MNRKYPEVKGYWVYSIQIKSNGKYYIGVSKLKCCQRWRKGCYKKNNSLGKYLDEWDSMVKTVLIDNLTKEQALKYEDNIIQALKMNNLCINEQRSGFITNDKNAYNREYLKNNPEYHEQCIERSKQWRLDNPEYCKQRYQNDAEFRERKKQRAKKYYNQKKLQKQNPQIN